MQFNSIGKSLEINTNACEKIAIGSRMSLQASGELKHWNNWVVREEKKN